MRTNDPSAARSQWTIGSVADLGRAVAGVRRARGLTQEQLAEKGGFDRSYLARLESGATTLMLERALRVLRRMGARVTVELSEDDAPSG